ncbi:MAG: hypothetical protein AB7F86_10660 [Bdellovibrionales bacterium]
MKNWPERLKLFFPLYAVVFTVVSIRGESHPEVLWVPGLLGFLYLHVTKSWRKNGVGILLAAIFASIWLSYVMHTHDFRYFLSSVTVYLMAVTVAVGAFRNRYGWKPCLLAGVLLGLVVDLSMATKPIRQIFSEPLIDRGSFHAPKETEFYPHGMLGPIAGHQAVEFLEISQKVFNFMGMRFLSCHKMPMKDPMSCLGEFRSDELSVWSPLYVTAEFFRLFSKPKLWETAQEKIKSSFKQGLVEDEEARSFSPAPIGDGPGMAIKKVNGREMQVQFQGEIGDRFVVPVLMDQLTVLSTGLLADKDPETGLITAELTSPSGLLTVKAPPKWSYVILLFWIPGLFLVLVLFSKLVRK